MSKPQPDPVSRALAVVALVALLIATALIATPAAFAQQRGYELVSPADDGSYDVFAPWTGGETPLGGGAIRRSTADGEHVVFEVVSTLPGMAPDGEIRDFGIASRGDAGWDWVVPLGDRSSVGGCNNEGDNVFLGTLSEDAGSLLLSPRCVTDRLLFSDGLDQTFGTTTLYTADVATDTAAFVAAKLGPDGPLPRTGNQYDDDYLGASADLSTIYFTTAEGLLPGMPDLPVGGVVYLYKRSGGATTVVSRTATGVPFGVLPFPSAGVGGLERPHAVSAGGDAVTFTAPAIGKMMPADTNSVTDVYQVRGGEAVWASKPTRVPLDTPANRVFEGSSADGDTIVFTSTERLTADDLDSRKDIFVYEKTGDQLTRLSTGPLNDAANTPADDAHFVTLSRDGSHVFFVSGSQLVPDDGDGGGSLYVRDLDSATTTYVAAATSASDSDVNTPGSLADVLIPVSGKWITVASDGQEAFFSLATDVTLPVGRGGPDADGAHDLFVWREGDGLRRIRQGLDTDANTAQVAGLGCFNQALTGYAAPCRAMTADGEHVFFETPSALVPEDDNGDLIDVYAMRTVDGAVELIAPASDDLIEAERGSSAQFFDSSASGHHVFFVTRETLDPSRDLDGGRIDVYSARIGDVFPERPAPPEPCAPGDGCQSPPQSPPFRPSLGTTAPGPSGNLLPGARLAVVVSRPRPSALRRAARTGRFSLGVRASAPTVLRARARARIGRKLRTVGTGRTRVRRPGKGRIALSLSRPVRQALGRGRRVRLHLQVSAPGGRAQTLTVILRGAGR